MRIFASIRMGSPAARRLALAAAFFFIGDLLWIWWRFPISHRSKILAQDVLPSTGSPVLILGAGVMPDKEPSAVLTQRLQVALELYRQGKVTWFLVSGDNRSPYYNEPQAMVRWLRRQGIPPTLIVSDYAGRRTWDSLRRARDVFGLNRLVIVTSDFHLSRALFIAERQGFQAWGVPAHTRAQGFWTRAGFWFREYGARHVAVWDSWFPPATRLGPREPTPEDWLWSSPPEKVP